MSDQQPGKGQAKPSQREEQRRKRLAEELRANLQRRKHQARARRAGDGDARPEGLPGAGGDDEGE